jgi:Rrf2 family nitric oxide-sensitive transcriptional repressor
MRLTDYTDYTLRTLMYLALHRDRLTTIQEIASAYDISKNHLMKVVHRLSLAGLVDTVRGRNGGLRLGKAPEKIRIGAVVRSTEPDFTVVECFDQMKDQCVLSPSCALKNVLYTATLAYLQQLDGITLADILKDAVGLPATSCSAHSSRPKRARALAAR